MKFLILVLPFMLIISSKAFCQDPDPEFEILMNKFVDEYLNFNPQTAVALGLHEFDGKISDYSIESFNKEIKWGEDYLKQLSDIDPSLLNRNNYINYKILKSEIQKTLFGLKDLETYKHDPSLYAGAIDANAYIKERLRTH